VEIAKELDALIDGLGRVAAASARKPA